MRRPQAMLLLLLLTSTEPRLLPESALLIELLLLEKLLLLKLLLLVLLPLALLLMELLHTHTTTVNRNSATLAVSQHAYA